MIEREAGGDDHGLAEVEHVERHLAADGGPFVAGAGGVEAARLVRLVAEILDRLVVEQAVDRPWSAPR